MLCMKHDNTLYRAWLTLKRSPQSTLFSIWNSLVSYKNITVLLDVQTVLQNARLIKYYR